MHKDTRKLKNAHRKFVNKARSHKKKIPSLKGFARKQVDKGTALSEIASGWLDRKGGK